MQKDKIFKTILLFCIPLLVLSCSKTAGDDPPGQDANLALALITRNGNGDLAITGEDRFTSLAVYIFNNDNDDLEFSELITDFTPESSASLYTKSVRVTQDKKAVYAIANYAGQSFTAAGQPVTITEQTPRSVLDALQVASATFAGNDIVMVGKKVMEMTGTAVNASIEMERLVGRLDLHVYKAAELTDDAVELVSIIFCNQVTKSNVQYQSNAMPAGDIRQAETHTPSAATLLEVVPDNTYYASRTPSDAETSFYSYQNISGAIDPSGSRPGRLLDTVPAGKCESKRRSGHLSRRPEESGRTVRPGTEQGIPYQDRRREPQGILYLRIEVLKWDTELSEITYDDRAFTFSGTDNGANRGEVSTSDPATFSFNLTAPAGAVWAASLTNGLDFKLLSEGDYVSQGITRVTPFYIRIVPTKTFSAGADRQSRFYITVDGQKRQSIQTVRKAPSTTDGNIREPKPKF